MDELQAALLLVKLNHTQPMVARRRHLADRYRRELPPAIPAPARRRYRRGREPLVRRPFEPEKSADGTAATRRRGTRRFITDCRFIGSRCSRVWKDLLPVAEAWSRGYLSLHSIRTSEMTSRPPSSNACSGAQSSWEPDNGAGLRRRRPSGGLRGGNAARLEGDHAAVRDWLPDD